MLVTVKKPIDTSGDRLLPGAVVDAASWANLQVLISTGYVAPVLAGDVIAPLVDATGQAVDVPAGDLAADLASPSSISAVGALIAAPDAPLAQIDEAPAAPPPGRTPRGRR